MSLEADTPGSNPTSLPISYLSFGKLLSFTEAGFPCPSPVAGGSVYNEILLEKQGAQRKPAISVGDSVIGNADHFDRCP